MTQRPNLELNEEQSLEQKFMTHLAVLEEQLKNLNGRVGELMTDMRDLKNLHIEKVITLEKEVSVLKEKVEQITFYQRLIFAVSISGFIGAVLSLILKH